MGIRLLARELNLSIGTVSHALNNRPDVNDDTRARVKEAAQRTGYVPDQSGRSLRKGRTGIVAVVIPTAGVGAQTDGGLFALLEGCRRGLRAAELDLVVLFRGPDEDALESLRRIVSRRIADAVIVNHTIARDPRLAYLRENGVEHVSLGRSAGCEPESWVDFDFEGAAAESARLFVGGGHRRFALVLGGLRMNYEDLLVEAFRAELARQGLRPETARVVRGFGARLPDEGRAVFSGPGAPTAVLAGHEGIAAALYGELAELGQRVGRNVALVSALPAIDNRMMSPRLTHFDADLDAAGVALAERLIAVLPERGDARRLPGPALVPMRLVARASHFMTAASTSI